MFTLAPSGKYDGSICAAAMRAVAAITVTTCSILIHKSNPIPLLTGTKGSLKIVAYLELSKLRPSLGKAPFSKKNSDGLLILVHSQSFDYWHEFISF